MKRMSSVQCYALLFLLCVTPFIFCADTIAQETERYICFDESVSVIGQVISDMSQFDTDLDSPLHLFRRYYEDGNVLALYDEIEAVLEYADSFLQQHEEVAQKNTMLCEQFEDVVNQFLKGELDITQEEIMRAPHLSLLTINKRMLVKGKAIFKNAVIIDKNLRGHGKARFYENAKFKKNVTIDGTLSVQDEVVSGTLSVQDVIINGTLSVEDQVVGCDLTVGCNINMNDSTSSAIGNIVKDGSPFIHNFGTSNTFVGVEAGNFTMTGIDNAGFGASALFNNTSGTGNTAVGSLALQNNTIGNANTGVGASALQANTTGVNNTAAGANALQSNLTGVNNTAVGSSALTENITGTDNTAVGYNALAANIAGIQSTAVGSGALASNLANVNTAVGYNALIVNTTGPSNTAVGANALQSNTIGNANTGVGVRSLGSNTTGTSNVAIGSGALATNVTGSQNVVIGAIAAGGFSHSSNNKNTFVGYASGIGLTVGDNNLYLGSNSGFAGAESNTTRIGNGTTAAAFMSGVFGATVGVTNSPVIIDNNGQLGTMVSSAVFKRNIEKMGIDSDRIYGLNPVKFMYKKDATNTLQYGLIAEEVAQVFPELVINDADGKPFTVRYEMLAVLLLNELKKEKIFYTNELKQIKEQLAQFMARS